MSELPAEIAMIVRLLDSEGCDTHGIEATTKTLLELTSERDRLKVEVEQYRSVIQDGRRLPDPELGQDAAYAAFVLGGLQTYLVEARADRDRLLAAIKAHHGQKADDRCWADDIALYSAAGLSTATYGQIGSPEAMMKNCERFVAFRCSAGWTGGNWKSYAQLEAELKTQTELVAKLDSLNAELNLLIYRARTFVNTLLVEGAKCLSLIAAPEPDVPPPPATPAGGPTPQSQGSPSTNPG